MRLISARSVVQLHLGPRNFVFLIGALSSSGRATDLHSVGEEFDSPRVHINAATVPRFVFFPPDFVSLVMSYDSYPWNYC